MIIPGVGAEPRLYLQPGSLSISIYRRGALLAGAPSLGCRRTQGKLGCSGAVLGAAQNFFVIFDFEVETGIYFKAQLMT
ncbi:hypothetical protein, partial [Hydrogenophaga aquatica]